MYQLISEMSNTKGVDFKVLYNKAIQIVADDIKVKNRTIRDKIERQSELKAKEAQQLLEDYFTIGETKIRTVLEGTVKRNFESEDRSAIYELFGYLATLNQQRCSS